MLLNISVVEVYVVEVKRDIVERVGCATAARMLSLYEETLRSRRLHAVLFSAAPFSLKCLCLVSCFDAMTCQLALQARGCCWGWHGRRSPSFAG